jgi:outer membrane protease
VIFVWWSAALKRYSSGHILIEAETVDDARNGAVHDFAEWLERERKESWTNWSSHPAPPPDEEDIEDRDRKIALFKQDIAKEPRQIGSAIFIMGSE